MRVNVYTEELLTDDVEQPAAEIVVAEYVSSRTGLPMKNYGLRIFMKSHQDLHYVPLRDDDRSAVTFWCGPSEKNISDLLDMLKRKVEMANLERFRDKVADSGSMAEAAEAGRNQQ
jgi:hypothetical protein